MSQFCLCEVKKQESVKACKPVSLIKSQAEGIGHELTLSEEKRKRDITFYGNDLVKTNLFFRQFILKPGILLGIRKYKKARP